MRFRCGAIRGQFVVRSSAHWFVLAGARALFNSRFGG